jgi:hypothetical protein
MKSTGAGVWSFLRTGILRDTGFTVVELLTEMMASQAVESTVKELELADEVGESEGHVCLGSKILWAQLGTLTWFSELLRGNVVAARVCYLPSVLS